MRHRSCVRHLDCYSRQILDQGRPLGVGRRSLPVGFVAAELLFRTFVFQHAQLLHQDRKSIDFDTPVHLARTPPNDETTAWANSFAVAETLDMYIIIYLPSKDASWHVNCRNSPQPINQAQGCLPQARFTSRTAGHAAASSSSTCGPNQLLMLVHQLLSRFNFSTVGESGLIPSVHSTPMLKSTLLIAVETSTVIQASLIHSQWIPRLKHETRIFR